MRRRHCRRMPRRARLLRKHLSEFTSWSQLLKKSGFPRFRRKCQVYKPFIELSTSNKAGKPESAGENRRFHSLTCRKRDMGQPPVDVEKSCETQCASDTDEQQRDN